MQFEFGLKNEDYKHCCGTETVFSRTPIRLVTAKRDWAAFQVIIRGTEDFTVSVNKNTVFHPVGPIKNVRLDCLIRELSGAVAAMYPIGLIEDDDRIMKSDLLLHNETVIVKRGDVQPVWIEVTVPESAQAGVYAGSVDIYAHAMFEDEVKIGSLSFEIDVRDVTLPLPEDYRFHLDLWQHLSNISRKHEVNLWSDEHFKVVEEYVKSLAQLGQKAVTIIASEIPWSGQACFQVRNYLSDLYEYNMARIERDENGKFIYDFSVIGKYVDMCFKYGIDREIEVFGLINIWVFEKDGYGKVAPDYPDAVRIRYFDRTDRCFKFMRTAGEIEEYVMALEKYFTDSGLIDRVLVVADEPSDIERYGKSLNTLKKVAPSFRYKTAINHAVFIGEFKNRIHDFVPYLECVCSEWDLLGEMRESIKGRLLWYVCCGPELPNTFIRSPLVESRLIGILTAFMNLDGFLRWNYTVWPEDPRKMICYRFPGWKAGDTNFVYPANDGRPILTLRYKILKRGIEDYELIRMLKQIHPEPEKIIEKAFGFVLKNMNPKEFNPALRKKAEELYSLEYDDYAKFKTFILEEIADITGNRPL